MNKFALIAALLAATLGASAQHIDGQQPARQTERALPAATRHSVQFESKRGETFTVFIDGLPVNRMPQSRVLATDVSGQEHEVVVVLKRPTDRAAVLSLNPVEASVSVNVTYDEAQERLYLYTAAANRGRNRNDYDVSQALDGANTSMRSSRRRPEAAERPQEPVAADTAAVEAPDDEAINLLILQMRERAFSDDRVALGKTLVAATPMTADQIARLAATIDYSSAQVDFLKYAYDYCLDPANYSRAVDVLSFSSDKRKVLEYIATH